MQTSSQTPSSQVPGTKRFQKEGATGHVFNLTTGGAPIPQKAQLPGNPVAISGWGVFSQLAD